MCQRRNIKTNKTFLETNECESITKENPWDTLETVVHATFIALMIMSKKIRKSPNKWLNEANQKFRKTTNKI